MDILLGALIETQFIHIKKNEEIKNNLFKKNSKKWENLYPRNWRHRVDVKK